MYPNPLSAWQLTVMAVVRCALSMAHRRFSRPGEHSRRRFTRDAPPAQLAATGEREPERPPADRAAA